MLEDLIVGHNVNSGEVEFISVDLMENQLESSSTSQNNYELWLEVRVTMFQTYDSKWGKPKFSDSHLTLQLNKICRLAARFYCPVKKSLNDILEKHFIF